MNGHSINIIVPDVDNMDDEALADLARLRDGRWSEQTKRLLRQFNTDKLSLNRQWAGTWQSWACPCCHRTKPQIVRVSAAGVLLCELESHHDHLGDKAGKLFEEINPKTEEREFNIQISHAKYGMLQFVERFQRTLICIDCNLVEGKAKKALGSDIEPDFTFSPREIATFIRASDNRVHELDMAAVRLIWDRVKPDIADRLDFAERMARRFANGKNRREVAVGTRAELWMDDRSIIWEQVAKAFPALPRGNSIGLKVLARSTSRDAIGTSARPKSKAPGRPPNPADLAYVEAINKEKKHWTKAGDDWTCGCCRRSKQDICRVSANSRKWTAQIHVVRDWIFSDDDPSALYWRIGSANRMIIDHIPVLVCQDCRLVVTKVQQMDDGIDYQALTIGDVAGGITVAPNQMHDVDYEAIKRRAHENTDLLKAVYEYREHENDARYYLGRIHGFMKVYRCSMDEARDNFAYEYAKAVDVELEEGHAFMNWMIAEGKRFERRREGE
ncbi:MULTISPECIES: hypothetical protein [unclassified Mesorhizobium]|uniref:hypothetical protein n=1 Tax=unclassified Mesorhizobium TaxID=325217 RepID=UPI00117F86CA|nr:MULTISPECIES: hypothetical protein [unclassified Mesorhizobium]